jgi:hypothetical protein
MTTGQTIELAATKEQRKQTHTQLLYTRLLAVKIMHQSLPTVSNKKLLTQESDESALKYRPTPTPSNVYLGRR